MHLTAWVKRGETGVGWWVRGQKVGDTGGGLVQGQEGQVGGGNWRGTDVSCR